MSAIPANPVSQEDLHKWYEINEQIKALKSQEVLLRQKIFNGMFVNPHEGTNSVDLADGWVLKGKRTINRDIDPGALDANRKVFEEYGIWTDQLVAYKPSLKIGMYRELTAEQQNIFDRCLIVKDGMPGLEIVLPKRRAQA